MENWQGSAGVCVNTKGQVLMVLQGLPEEKKAWTIPSGGKEDNETFEECCIREIREETGYDTRIIQPLFSKKSVIYGINVEVQYFEVEITGGEAKIQDPDNLIHKIAWKSANEISKLELSFPEDREFLIQTIR
ncbi:Diadenosine hexaphosphate hydrolase [Bacillus sp. THAF10]|uniref:NUDIX hydrolase n=1 Tax=Bacillus sp. THAF10 TaxID=2587848 RepID=UPI001267FF64|nr:NUDIX hydrolase [Bacillus sp. THAF10]QFT87583.1 Diadenosine hexaphosphate hydrolase [Bacillus sp. THAF10]